MNRSKAQQNILFGTDCFLDALESGALTKKDLQHALNVLKNLSNITEALYDVRTNTTRIKDNNIHLQ